MTISDFIALRLLWESQSWMSNRNLHFLSYPNKGKQVIERRSNTPCPRSIKQPQSQHRTTQVGLIPNMKTLTTCILLTLAAAAVHCRPLAEVTATDEALAEVWKPALLFYSYACVCSPWVSWTREKQVHIFHDKLFYLVQSYLRRFFNLTTEQGPSVRRRISSFSLKLSEMQRFFGLQITGALDENTVELMKKPRCGVPDGNIAEYSTFGSNLKWQKNSLTYR